MLAAAPVIGPNGNCASIRAPARYTGTGTPGTFDVTKSTPRSIEPKTPVETVVGSR